MRVPLTLKICAGALFLAVLQAVIAIAAFRALQAPQQAGTAGPTGTVATLNDLQSSLAALAVGEDFLFETDRTRVEPFIEHYRGQLQGALDHLARDTGNSKEQVAPAVSAFKELLDSALLQGAGEGSTGTDRLQQHWQAATAEVKERLAQEQRSLEQAQLRVGKDRERAAILLLLLAGAGTVVGVGFSLLVARRVGLSLDRLNYATSAISEGAFDTNPQVTSNDELGDLATGLGVMAQKLKNYEQLCLDASPLTRLPGNIAIERALNDRLRMGEKFALCYVDLDNFKAYNDRYGYAKGSDIIKATGEILYECCRRHGRVEDFVGHIGGDDFVLITSPDLVAEICEAIILDFDRMIPTYYSAQDLERGFVEAIDRYGVTRQFPIMTLSIAVVSDDKRQIHSPQEIAQVASEIKDYVKAMPGSNYLVDRRRGIRN